MASRKGQFSAEVLTAPLCNFFTAILFRKISQLSCKLYKICNDLFVDFLPRFFRGVPENRPNHRHVYAVSDDWQSGVGSPVCLSCNLPKNISQKCHSSSNNHFKGQVQSCSTLMIFCPISHLEHTFVYTLQTPCPLFCQ